MKSPRAAVLLVVLGVALGLGLEQLFELRFDTGDVFPPYSTLRADPLGAMALYESLGKLNGLSVRRDFSASGRLPDEPDTTYVQLANPAGAWNGEPMEFTPDLRDFLTRGGRLVITYFPKNRAGRAGPAAGAAGTTNPPPDEAPPGPEPGPEPGPDAGPSPWQSAGSGWDFSVGFLPLPAAGIAYSPATARRAAALDLPDTLPWHSGLIFTRCGAGWRTIYARADHPVVIERAFGRGSVVIATDSYFASNEAMWRNCQPGWLAWLLGPRRHVVFDEAHFGLVDAPGVAGLMRQYHLHGLAAGLLLLAGLFIWKNATSLEPPRGADAPADVIAGKDAAAGFVNLLRRHVAPRDLLAVCFAAWRQSAAGATPPARLEQAAAVVAAEQARPAKARDPAAACRELAAILGRRRHPL